MTAGADVHDETALKERIAAELEGVRRRSVGLTTAVLDQPELLRQHSRLMSPLVWDLAHVGNYEELWLLRTTVGAEALVRPEIDDIYDAFEHPRAERPQLPLLLPTEAEHYLGLVRRKVLDALDAVRLTPANPLLDGGFVFGMVVQHEHQHDETMLATHQLRRGEPVLPPDEPLPAAAVPADGPLPAEVRVPAGEFLLGTSTQAWAYDNERPAHPVRLTAFRIDRVPVSNRAYAAFVADGGYDDPRHWSPTGYAHLRSSGRRAPMTWRSDGAGWWTCTRFGEVQPVDPDEPVQHVCFWEADAYARWAGRRLPTEQEWEKACGWDPAAARLRRWPWGDADPTPVLANLGGRAARPAPVGAYPDGASPCGAEQMVGDVWEWTSSGFEPWPGFRAFPYPEYSAVFFGGDYRCLRGGSWATHPTAARTTFRNWDVPVRRQIFAGFRTAADVR